MNPYLISAINEFAPVVGKALVRAWNGAVRFAGSIFVIDELDRD